jgi:hypothetical protein
MVFCFTTVKRLGDILNWLTRNVLLQDSQTEISKTVQQQLQQMPDGEEGRITEGNCDENVDAITYIQVRFYEPATS